MKELIKELEESIYDCKIEASNGVDNLDCVSDAIELLDKLKEAINYTHCCTEFADCKCKPMVNADWTYLKCECGKRFKPKG
jgi:hypothetical protein